MSKYLIARELRRLIYFIKVTVSSSSLTKVRENKTQQHPASNNDVCDCKKYICVPKKPLLQFIQLTSTECHSQMSVADLGCLGCLRNALRPERERKYGLVREAIENLKTWGTRGVVFWPFKPNEFFTLPLPSRRGFQNSVLCSNIGALS